MVTLPTSSEISQIEWDNEKTTGAYSGAVAEFDSAVWLTLDVTAGKSYYLYAQSFAYFVNEPWVSVYNAAGELITEVRYSGLAELTLSPTATGRLYIELKNTSGYPGMMDFIVTETPATTSFDDDADRDDNQYIGTYGERIFGFWEDDYIQIGTGADASGGRGDDYIIGNDNPNRIWGDHGEDTIHGQGGSDRIWGGTGQDSITGGAGDDQLFGGEDFDQIYGGSANDRIFGGAGSDLLDGGADLDTIYGGNGGDRIDGGTGADSLSGGFGNDVYYMDDAGDNVIEGKNAGYDHVYSSVGWTMAGSVERVTLTGAANINVAGNGESNTITGNTGNNLLFGNGGNDTILGGDGNDRISGGAGNDNLAGGAGADVFVFNTTANASTNVDTITDYNVAADTIWVDNAIFNAVGANGALSAAAFRVDTIARDADDRIIYNASTGTLTYDGNGNGAGGAVQIAKLTVGLALTSADFFVL